MDESLKQNNFKKLMDSNPEMWCAICYADLTNKKWWSTPSHMRSNIRYCEVCKPPLYTPAAIAEGIVIVGHTEEDNPLLEP